MTINDGLEQFLQMMFYERNISNNSLDAYKEDLKTFFKYIGKDNCEELNIEDLESFIRYLSSQGKASSTIVRTAGTIKQFYIYLQTRRIINNKVSLVELPKKDNYLPDVLSTEEVEKLFAQPDLNKPDGTSIWMVNTNKLIKYYNGLDGLKTGFTKNAGYCLTSTAKRNDMRLISVIMKEETSQKRNEETTKLLDYGFTNYKIKTIVSTNDNIGSVYIFNSKKENYDLTINGDATNLEGLNETNNYSYNVNLDKVKAPIKVGDKIGTLDVISNGKVIKNIDITVKEDVIKANIFDLIKRNLKLILAL